MQAYQLLLDAGGAAEAQQVVADSQKTAAAYGQLAFFLYADFKFPEGDAAAKQAVAASDPGDRKAIEKSLASLAERARKQKELTDKAGAAGPAGRRRPTPASPRARPIRSAPSGPSRAAARPPRHRSLRRRKPDVGSPV